MAKRDREDIELNKEIIKVEEKKQVFYQYKKVKLQHNTIDGKTECIYLATTNSNLYGGSSEIRYSEEEAKTLLTILQEVFSGEEDE